MGLLCQLRGHKVGSEEVFNQGYYFSRCTACESDVIRTSGNWRTLPAGYKINWRSGEHRHAIASDFRRNLPIMAGEMRKSNRLPQRRPATRALPAPQREARSAQQARREETFNMPAPVISAMVGFMDFVGRSPQRG